MTAPPKVLAYTETYVLGGCDRYLADLANALDPREFQLTVAGNPNPAFDEWLAEHAPSLLPRRTIDVASLLSGTLSRGIRDRDLHRPAAVDGDDAGVHGGAVRAAGSAVLRAAHHALNFRRLRRLFREARPDVIHVNNGGYPGGESCRTAALAAHAEGIPVVHFVHNMAYPPRFPRRAELRLDRGVDEATVTWMTAAQRASATLHRERDVQRDKVETVYYGVAPAPAIEPAALAGVGNRPVTVVVASFELRKGHDILFEALAQLASVGTHALTLLVGEGPRRPVLEETARRLGLADDVRFLGWRDDVAAILAASDLLVLPSTGFECLPYAILEGMAAGLPVVSTDVAGIPEMVLDGQTGRVVAPADAAALAAAIGDVIGRPDKGAALGQAGRERLAREFTIERMVDRTTDIWRRALGATEPRR